MNRIALAFIFGALAIQAQEFTAANGPVLFTSARPANLRKLTDDLLCTCLISTIRFARQRNYFSRITEKDGLHAPTAVQSGQIFGFCCDRSRLQDRDRFPAQTIWDILDGSGSQCQRRPAMLPSQRPV